MDDTMKMVTIDTDRHMQRGDVYWCEIVNAIGSEQAKNRPAIIVSSQAGVDSSPVVNVVYTTGEFKIGTSVHPEVLAKKKSYAITEQVTTVSKSRLFEYIRTLTREEMDSVNRGMALSLGLDNEYTEDKATDLRDPDYKSSRHYRVRDFIDKLIDRDNELSEIERSKNDVKDNASQLLSDAGKTALKQCPEAFNAMINALASSYDKQWKRVSEEIDKMISSNTACRRDASTDKASEKPVLSEKGAVEHGDLSADNKVTTCDKLPAEHKRRGRKPGTKNKPKQSTLPSPMGLTKPAEPKPKPHVTDPAPTDYGNMNIDEVKKLYTNGDYTPQKLAEYYGLPLYKAVTFLAINGLSKPAKPQRQYETDAKKQKKSDATINSILKRVELKEEKDND